MSHYAPGSPKYVRKWRIEFECETRYCRFRLCLVQRSNLKNKNPRTGESEFRWFRGKGIIDLISSVRAARWYIYKTIHFRKTISFHTRDQLELDIDFTWASTKKDYIYISHFAPIVSFTQKDWIFTLLFFCVLGPTLSFPIKLRGSRLPRHRCGEHLGFEWRFLLVKAGTNRDRGG